MTPLARVKNSRNSWKSKATERAEQIRELRKTTTRHRSRIEDLQAQVKALEQKLASKKKR
jgi:uncharacterized protein YlxW (UPF0749 family)